MKRSGFMYYVYIQKVCGGEKEGGYKQKNVIKVLRTRVEARNVERKAVKETNHC